MYSREIFGYIELPPVSDPITYAIAFCESKIDLVKFVKLKVPY